MQNANRSAFDAWWRAIDAGAIALWGIPPRAGHAALDDLSDEDRAAVERMPSTSRRESFLACRSFLRRVLGHRLNRAPRDVSIVLSQNGRPTLAGNDALSFSISHSDGLSLLALCSARRVGVDLERRRARDFSVVAEAFLPAGWEAGVLDDRDRTDAFLRAWTANEARVKATGQGLVLPADASVPGAGSLRVERLDVAPAYVASLAADGPPWRSTLTFIGSGDA